MTHTLRKGSRALYETVGRGRVAMRVICIYRDQYDGLNARVVVTSTKRRDYIRGTTHTILLSGCYLFPRECAARRGRVLPFEIEESGYSLT